MVLWHWLCHSTFSACCGNLYLFISLNCQCLQFSVQLVEAVQKRVDPFTEALHLGFGVIRAETLTNFSPRSRDDVGRAATTLRIKNHVFRELCSQKWNLSTRMIYKQFGF